MNGKGYIKRGIFCDGWEEVDILSSKEDSHINCEVYLVKDKNGKIFSTYDIFEKKD